MCYPVHESGVAARAVSLKQSAVDCVCGLVVKTVMVIVLLHALLRSHMLALF
jgi:hypothetical protein